MLQQMAFLLYQDTHTATTIITRSLHSSRGRSGGPASRSPSRSRSPPRRGSAEKAVAAPADPDDPRRVHVGRLTRNVADAHVKEIFSTWGEVLSARVAVDERVQLSKGYAIVEYATHAAAQAAVDHMDGGQLDGNTLV
jgi:RNA recognition motif-containing protein